MHAKTVFGVALNGTRNKIRAIVTHFVRSFWFFLFCFVS